MFSIKYTANSQQGKKSKENEDSFLLPVYNKTYKMEPDTENKGSLFLLCDGMGGENAGEVASILCCEWFFKEFYEENDKIPDYIVWLDNEIQSLNSRLFELSTKHDQYSGMGTTLVSLLIKDDKAIINSIGDSRIYHLRKGELKQITDDDTDLWRLFKNGSIKKDEIQKSKRKNVINQALAIGMNVKIHGYGPILLFEHDVFLLCSDGLTDYVKDLDIEIILKEEITNQEKIKKLTDLAIKNGTDDDCTLVIVEL